MNAKGVMREAEMVDNFLDSHLYTAKGILLYESIFGRTFISAGGRSTTASFASEYLSTHLANASKVLDIGCGTGGSAFYFATTFGANVYGIDLSRNMLHLATQYRENESAGVAHRVQFHLEDAMGMNYPHNFYDLVYSRDSILHIADKESLFKNFYRTLKPGGKLLITDYCRGPEKAEDASEEFRDYVKERDYSLLTIQQYGETLEKAGFNEGNVLAIDRTSEFKSILEDEMEKFKARRAEVIENYSQDDFNYVIEQWEKKMMRCNRGDQAWGFFLATKDFH